MTLFPVRQARRAAFAMKQPTDRRTSSGVENRRSWRTSYGLALLDRLHELGTAELRVLLVLGWHADEHGIARPGADRLLALCGISRATLWRAVVELERLGIIEVIGERTTAPGRVTTFRVTTIGPLSAPERASSVKRVERPERASTMERVRLRPATSERVDALHLSTQRASSVKQTRFIRETTPLHPPIRKNRSNEPNKGTEGSAASSAEPTSPPPPGRTQATKRGREWAAVVAAKAGVRDREAPTATRYLPRLGELIDRAGYTATLAALTRARRADPRRRLSGLLSAIEPTLVGTTDTHSPPPQAAEGPRP